MKKFISVALVLMLVVALATATFSALPSPAPGQQYSVSTSVEGNGSASSDKSSVAVSDPDGNVTLTAVDNGGFFTKWIMDGHYEEVSGTEYDPIFVIKPLSDVKAIASFSIEKDYLTIINNTEGEGTMTADPQKVLKGSGDTVTLTAIEGAEPFTKWELACQYDIISGSLTEKTLVIKPYTDVYATAYFGSSVTPTPTPDDGGNTSPKTGDNTVMVVAIVLMAMALGLFAVKKIKE